MKNKLISLIVAIAIINVMASSIVIAQQESFASKSDCTKGSALDQYVCLDEELNLLEKKLVETLEKNIAATQSEGGKDAVEEVKNRMLVTQDAWIKYRDNQCSQNYYSKAPIHAPSQSLSITICKIYKTKNRLQEICENSNANLEYKAQFSDSRFTEERKLIYKIFEPEFHQIALARNAMKLAEDKISILLDKVDINNDQIPDLLAYIYSSYHCSGNRGCKFYVYLSDKNNKIHEIYNTTLPSEDVWVLTASENGYKDLKVSAWPESRNQEGKNFVILRWNGEKYLENK